MRSRQYVPPAARTTGLIVQELPDEVLVYDEERHKAHCLNRTASLVWRACDGRRSVAAIASQLDEALTSPTRESSVLLALQQLDKARLLDGPIELRNGTAISRRAVIGRLGAAAAIALPVITSIATTRAQDGDVSCKPQDAACDLSSQENECCPGLTCSPTDTFARSTAEPLLGTCQAPPTE